MSVDPQHLAALRQDYSLAPLRRSDLLPDPIPQFLLWLDQARKAEVIEPNAMVLSTVDPEGQPWSRTVLLKACDPSGFTFFTNYQSSKGTHLANHPKAALTFWWGPLERQVNITGTVTRTSVSESETYFQSRPIKSQIGAWASMQSQIVPDRTTLERQFQEVEERFPEGPLPLPPHWGGFRLAPKSIEFWQGRRSRLHDRFRYEKQSSGWALNRLSP
jgi:pyridoxamine 5'-phosphate oxidase